MSELEVKSYSKPIVLDDIGEDGRFSGYALTYDLDYNDDIILRKAVDNWLARPTTDKKLVTLWQHDWEEPIGLITNAYTDNKGLYVEGELTLGVQRADEARLHYKKGSMKRLSIGYFVLLRDYEGTTRIIEEIEITELSLVTRGMNPNAKMHSMKSAQHNAFDNLLACDSIRSLERTLRDEAGASNSEAKRFISHLKNLCDADRQEQKQMAQIALALQSILEGQK